MAKVDKIQDEKLRASLKAAHASLRAGDHRDVVQRGEDPYGIGVRAHTTGVDLRRRDRISGEQRTALKHGWSRGQVSDS